MSSVWIRTRVGKKRATFQVLYRTGGRESSVCTGGTYRSLSEAERARDLIADELAACRLSKVSASNREPELVYIAAFEGLRKIGCSVDPARRCRALHAELLHVEPGGRARERELHKMFSHLRVRGEFFRPGKDKEISRYIRLRRTA